MVSDNSTGVVFMITGNSDFDHSSQFIPFKLDMQSTKNPTYFRLRNVFDGVIYTYSLVLNNNRILLEKLEYSLASTKRDRLLFSRKWNEEHQKFDWKNGSDFSGAHIQLEKTLKESEPFISILFKLAIKIIQPFIDWLYRSRFGIEWGHDESDRWFINFVFSDQSFLQSSQELSEVFKNTKNLLLKFDTGLFDILIKETENEKKNHQIYALHKASGGEIISWRFEQESIGTQKLFNLAYRMEFVFLRNCLVIADELGSNIHPNIIREIIKLFQNPKTNPNRTQLIFTSHDNTLQRNNLLRRDQIWFTQKRPDQSTELYPLSDFKVRNDLAIDKAYLDGRFGAVPFISEEDDFMPVGEDNG